MTGMERNGDLVRLASFAPLMMNFNHKPVDGANVLVFYDNHRQACTQLLQASQWMSNELNAHVPLFMAVRC